MKERNCFKRKEEGWSREKDCPTLFSFFLLWAAHYVKVTKFLPS